MASNIRVRFAPSPTGALHIGGLRTALYNYLFAKKLGGTFILRIEDTDSKRFVEGAEEYIIEALEWCGIPYDEGPGKDGGFGPYHQSKRKDIYVNYVDELINSGHAYYAFDTPEELDKIRSDYEAEGKTFSYSWETRDQLKNSLSLPAEEVAERLKTDNHYVVRFKPPRGEDIHMKDLIRGDITVNSDMVDDKVLFKKSDGLPTYHMANIVDDHLMQISHVIRGEEWIPSMAMHVLLYRAFGWEPPQFAHLPLILKPTGKGKLSKRDGDKMGFPVFPLEWKDPNTGDIAMGYRESGYLPQAVINMLAFLGWNPGDGSEEEFFSLEELVDAFSLERVSKAGARFDFEKTKWYQHHYFQKEDNKQLSEAYFEILKNKGIKTSLSFVEEIVDTVKERANFVSDFWELSSFYFEAPRSFDEKAAKKAWKADTSDLMNQVKDIISQVSDFSIEELEKQVKGWITSNEIGFGRVMMPLRLSMVGQMMGPDLFHIIHSVGKEETLSRLDYAIQTLG